MKTILLLSGGIDSTTLMYDLRSTESLAGCLFVDYGQPAAAKEWETVQGLTADSRATTKCIQLSGVRKQTGEIPGRNALLISCALVAGVPVPGALAIAIHSGTRYVDCSKAFVETIQRLLDLHYDGRLHLLAPYLRLTKQEIVLRARGLGVPLDRTFSCENPDPGPCGRCPSCLDRQRL